jgi:hypothetical protein
MSVPYSQPLEKWVTDELDSRIKNPTNLIKRMPFIMLTSAAVVTKSKQTQEQLRESFVNKNYNGEYYGCVLANTTDVSKLYQTGESIIGYDLKGKPIKVTGETNRKVSVPLITSLEIDTDGNNNTLKIATLQIKVFTLKQLEMFELFFLRPSMKVLLEYGNNSDLVSDNTLIKSNMFPKNNYEDFIKEFTEWFSPLPDGWKKSKKKYLEKLKETKGNYDYWAGQITQFSFSIDADGTYNVSLEVSAGNELVTQIPTQEAKPEGKQKAKIKKDKYASYIAKIEEDIDTKFKESFKTKWKKEFFNWDTVNLKTKDNTISKDAYISFRLILEIINSLNLDIKIRYGKYGNEDIIPVSSTKYIISSWKDFILPGDLPKIKVDESTGKIVVKTKKVEINGKDVYEIEPESSTISSKINDYSFNVTNGNDAIKNYQIPTDETNITLPYVGNLLNAFIKYDKFIEIYKKSFTVADTISSLLEMFNLHMYGLCYLELASSDGIFSDRSKGLTIIDRKLLRMKINKDAYRFKVGAIDSIVRNFSFSLEMSTLMQGQALYSSQLAIASAGKKVDDLKDKNLKYPMEAFSNADLSYAKNADGYYSINSIEVELQHILAEERKKRNPENTPTPLTGTTTTDNKEEEKIIVEESKQKEDLMNQGFIRFKMGENEKLTRNLIYENPQLLQYYLHKQSEPDAVMISPIEITLAIDGLAGVSCGQYFKIDGVPEIYNENGVFQVMNTKQGINEEGWLTTLVANWLPKYEM